MTLKVKYCNRNCIGCSLSSLATAGFSCFTELSGRWLNSESTCPIYGNELCKTQCCWLLCFRSSVYQWPRVFHLSCYVHSTVPVNLIDYRLVAESASKQLLLSDCYQRRQRKAPPATDETDSVCLLQMQFFEILAVGVGPTQCVVSALCVKRVQSDRNEPNRTAISAQFSFDARNRYLYIASRAATNTIKTVTR